MVEFVRRPFNGVYLRSLCKFCGGKITEVEFYVLDWNEPPLYVCEACLFYGEYTEEQIVYDKTSARQG